MHEDVRPVDLPAHRSCTFTPDRLFYTPIKGRSAAAALSIINIKLSAYIPTVYTPRTQTYTHYMHVHNSPLVPHFREGIHHN